MSDPVGGIVNTLTGGLLGGSSDTSKAEQQFALMFHTMMQNMMNQNMDALKEAGGDDEDYPNPYDGF